ncbi:hypothetical protein FZ029_13470 [Azospirillum sp. Sh1]|nr:hypothetical protein FZ029_13470 [Azospirillum sp. Sh1]
MLTSGNWSLHKEARHSREGGNPAVSAISHRSFLDPRLRGDDGKPFLGIWISKTIATPVSPMPAVPSVSFWDNAVRQIVP